MVAQIRGSRIRRGDDLDIEAVEQRPWTELRVGHTISDLVIDRVGSLGARDQIDTEDLDELVLQPVARGRAAEELPVFAERTPDLP
jgi:hypothetical protein